MSIKIFEFFNLLFVLLFSFLLSYLIISKLLNKSLLRQVERDFTLNNHIKKKGTPTSGGIVFIISILSSLIFMDDLNNSKELIVIIISVLLFFLVGLIDDYLKTKLSSFEGLSGKIRLLLEFIITFIFMHLLNLNNTFIVLDFIDLVIPIGLLFIPLILIINVGICNAVNLSDGLDGLASGLILLSLIPFLIISLNNNIFNLSILIVSLIGSLIAFLTFNIHPAKIFMGDSGSLCLGSFICLIAIYLAKYETLLIVSSFFLFEALSVVIQVIYFKMTKKRIFLMAPFHHHLEKKGIPEFKIVMHIWVYQIIIVIISVLMEVL